MLAKTALLQQWAHKLHTIKWVYFCWAKNRRISSFEEFVEILRAHKCAAMAIKCEYVHRVQNNEMEEKPDSKTANFMPELDRSNMSKSQQNSRTRMRTRSMTMSLKKIWCKSVGCLQYIQFDHRQTYRFIVFIWNVCMCTRSAANASEHNFNGT